MLKKILLGLFSLKFFAVLGAVFGKWVLALPIGGFFSLPSLSNRVKIVGNSN